MNKLEFKKHINGSVSGLCIAKPGWESKQAKLFFENGYGVSVITGAAFYCNNKDEYELAVLAGDEDGSELCYDTPITDDVLGYMSIDEINEIVEKIKLLPKRN